MLCCAVVCSATDNGWRKGNVITLSESEAQRLLRLGVIVPLAEMKGDGRTG